MGGFLTFTKKILSAYKRHAYENLTIIGPQGSGKTTYALLVLHEVYDGDWDKVLRYTVFDPSPLFPEFKEALRSGKRIKAVLFDDAGVWFSKYMFYISKKYAMMINALFNMIRTITASTIFTSPDLDVLKEIRKKSWWIGEPQIPPGVDINTDYKRYMVLYKKRILASGMVYVGKRAIDEYYLKLPSDVRKQYEEKRREALEPLTELLEEIMIETKNKITEKVFMRKSKKEEIEI